MSARLRPRLPHDDPQVPVASVTGTDQNGHAMIGEFKLLTALLENAQSAYRRGNRKEVEDWVSSEDRSWPSAFVNVCEALGLEPKSAREHIMILRPRWKADAETQKNYDYRWRAKNRPRYLAYLKEWKAKNGKKNHGSAGGAATGRASLGA